jgi:aryl-alcohol dehydrogenase-like predicted oxidoreductase
MKYRNIGKSGLLVSEIGLGCNNFGGRLDLEASRAVIHKALDSGITLFDTADIYGGAGASEIQMGKILGTRRKDIVLATKFGFPVEKAAQKGASRRYIVSAVEASLRRLNTDWIDLYQLHAPDPLTPMEETLRALDDLVHQGKVRYIGCSNVPAWGVADASWIAKHNGLNGFISCQDEYSLVERKVEPELIPAAEAFGLGLLPYFPLASGLLSGKYKKNTEFPEGARLTVEQSKPYYNRFLSDDKFDKIELLTAFAEKSGHSLLELAFSWLLGHRVVCSVIAGATKPVQVEQNARAVDWVLTAEDLSEIDKITS